MLNQLFQIGDFIFRLVCNDDITIPRHFMKFKTENVQESYTYTIEINGRFPEPAGKLIVSRPDLLIYQTEVGETRYIGIKGINDFYGYYREVYNTHAEILVSPNYLDLFYSDPVFNSLLALERHLIDYDSFVLHCAYMRYKSKAILFSAPSETGKTTQANLWGQYRGGETINGDKGLLQKVNDTWMVKGWPVCGSSDICMNEETPIQAIVMLSQGKSNTVERLAPSRAFIQIYSQITINRWNAVHTTKAVEMLEKLVSEVPVYHLSCTISKEAVECLEAALFQF